MTKQEAMRFYKRSLDIFGVSNQEAYNNPYHEAAKVAIKCIDKCIEHEDKIDKIRFICNFEVGSRHEICDKILAVIDGSDKECD